MASNKRDPLCATMVGSVKVVWVCDFGNPQRRAQSHVVPCRLRVCVYCARHLVAKLNGLKQTRSTLRHSDRFGQSCVCVCVLLVTLNVRDLRQGYDIADNISHAMTPIMSHAH